MKKETENILLIGGIAVAYFGIVRPLLIKLKLQKDPEVKATEDRKQQQLLQQIQQVSQYQQPTKSVQEWQVIADQIYNDLRYSAIDDNKDDAAYQAARVKNDADFWLLYRLFGKRREYIFGINAGGLMNLPQFLISNLSKTKIAQLNDNYARKGLKFRY